MPTDIGIPVFAHHCHMYMDFSLLFPSPINNSSVLVFSEGETP